jgi:uncharacterized protein with PIN domain
LRDNTFSSIIINVNRQYNGTPFALCPGQRFFIIHMNNNPNISPTTVRFVTDSMLGKLAKWLRILGYDTHYQTRYTPGTLSALVKEGRILLSRHQGTVDQYPGSICIQPNLVGDQLAQLKKEAFFSQGRATWFSRCLICNTLLADAPVDEAREHVPEYVFHENINDIRYCPACKKYYWPGSHRKRMLTQLEKWGFS